MGRIEKNKNDNAREMLLIALVYKAIEGNREGFLAFGTLIFDPMSDEIIQSALRKSIEMARRSTSFFNGQSILKRPNTISGPTTDLTGLPIHSTVKLFGKLKYNVYEKGAIEEIASIGNALFAGDWTSFEIVINAQSGMNETALIDFLKEQLTEQTQRAKDQEDERKKDEKEQAWQKRQDELDRKKASERNAKIFNWLAYGITSLALILLGVVVAAWWYKEPETQKQPPEPKNVADPNTEDKQTEMKKDQKKEEVISCILEELTNADRNKPLIVTDLTLTSNSECTKLSNSTKDFLLAEFPAETAGIDYLTTSNSNNFNIFADEPKENEMRLTSFQNLADSLNFDKDENIFVDLQANLDLNKSMSLAISFSENSDRLFCNDATFSNNDDTNDKFQLKYFTQSNGPYKFLVKTFTESFTKQIANVFDDMSTNIRNIDQRDDDILFQSNRFKKLADIFNNIEIKRFLIDDDSIPEFQSFCLIVFSDQDAEILDRHPALKEYNINYFFDNARLLTKYKTDLRNITQDDNLIIINPAVFPSCMKIPNYFMFWNNPEKTGDRFWIENNITKYKQSEVTADLDLHFKDIRMLKTEAKLLPKIIRLEKSLDELSDLFSIKIEDKQFPIFNENKTEGEDVCKKPQ